MTELDDLARGVVAITAAALRMLSTGAKAVKQKFLKVLLCWNQRSLRKSLAKASKPEQKYLLEKIKLHFEKLPKEPKAHKLNKK